MPVLVHASHPGTPGALPTHEPGHAEPDRPRPKWLVPLAIAAAVLVVLMLTGIALRTVSAPPASDGDAGLAALQRGKSARAHAPSRSGTAAGVAGRILSGESGRRMQQQMLDEPDK